MLRKSLLALSLAAATFGLLPNSADAQLFFEADAVWLGRDNDAGGPIVSGPEAITNNPGGFNAETGYRLRLGGIVGDYQVDAVFTQINPWAVSTGGDFDRIVVFDDTANNRFVSPFQEANALTQYAGLREAALNSLAASDESTEGEFLLPGATYQNSYRSDYRDFEINVGTNYYCRRWRVAAGYRHVRLDESSTFLMQGTFDALDVDDGARPGDMMNDPNDGLSHGAMIEAGFVNVAGGADGFDARVLNTNPPVPPDIIAYETQGRAYNELNGGQFTGAFLLVDREVFQLESVFKAGIYRNEVSGQVRETVAGLGNDDSVYQRALTDDRMKPAFVGQIGFQGILALTDYINVRAGYDVIFLSGVALGPDQWLGLSTDNFGATTYRVRTGSMVVHGGNVGLEFLW